MFNLKMFLATFLSGLCGYLTGAILEILGYLTCVYLFKSETAGIILGIILFPLAIYIGSKETRLICKKLL